MNRIIGVAACLSGASIAAGNVFFVEKRADLGGTDKIHWEQYGADYTPVPSGSKGFTDLGGLFTVSQPSGLSLEKRTNPYGGWWGNFADGDAVMWTQYNGDTIRIDFDAPMRAVGAQIQNDFYGGFTGRIEAFGQGGNSLGYFDRPGDSNGNVDNSALFLGIRSDQAIWSVEFSVANTYSMAINFVDLDRVPAPGSAALLALGALAARRRR